LFGGLLSFAVRASQVDEETIVPVQHEEKSPVGLGQLTCDGLKTVLSMFIESYGNRTSFQQ
jgi:hypothetical protein